MLALAGKVLSDEAGLKTLIRDVRAKLAAAAHTERAVEGELERLRSKLITVKAESKSWGTFLTILEGLLLKWGIQDVEVLPTKSHSQEAPGGAPAPQNVDPETKARLDEGKFCLFKAQETKKWCPISLTPKQKKAGFIYCTKHEEIVNGSRK